MSHTGRNFVVAYVLLVGLPLLGLAGVLRSGRSLKAPVSVDGTWNIQGDKPSGADPCAGAVAAFLNSPLLISQSGKSLELTFTQPKAYFTGVLEGTQLKALLPQSALPTQCRSLALSAMVDAKSEPRSLTGQFVSTASSSFAPIPFHAVRQPRSATGGTH
jgi:hypothetical protein